VVEQLPSDNVQTDWLNEPAMLLVLQVIVPVGLNPDTVAVQATGQPTKTRSGEQETNVWELRRN
jgi:hypothetical protein